MEPLASCQREPNHIMRANSSSFSCAPHCRLKAHSQKVLSKDRFYFAVALCSKHASAVSVRGKMEAAQGPLGAVVLRCRGPLRRRIPRSDPSRPARREHRGLGRPGKGIPAACPRSAPCGAFSAPVRVGSLLARVCCRRFRANTRVRAA